MKVGGKRFPRRGNRRRPPKAACGAPLKRSFCHPTALPFIAALGYRTSGDTKLASESIAFFNCYLKQKIQVSSASKIAQDFAKTYCLRLSVSRFRSDQKARLSSKGGTAKRFSFRKPSQGIRLAAPRFAQANRGFCLAHKLRTLRKQKILNSH